ncbi:Late embryogenesis abundant protein LEA_2 subgroup [Arabidopsis suecica]|uniref:Late embryogenesis abundant protein LEA_2 subgroup n=1 Tax=Arabidopsis suecica TaxID=45249 RepID=A0A8T2BAG0_ARASU|nr:Late embryogenesis abundant protein LEA_2 subgroup [Arabidopsis suecica]
MLSAKSDSETSLAASTSSPSRSSKRTFYYVQSPSRDDSSTSVIQPSPMDSPTHDSSSLGRHSRNSSASRFSGFRSSSSGRKNGRKWKSNEQECKVILEEGSSYDEMDDATSIRRCQALLAVFTLVVLFIFFCFIVWGASRPYKAQISVQTFELHNFYVGEGSDFSGVSTKVVTLNGTLRIRIYNPAPVFGIHVSSTPINLFFYQLPIATGQLKEHYQLKKRQEMESIVVIEGRRVPLYGAGASLEATERGGKIPVKLRFEVQSRGDVVGKLVRIWHTKRISCTFVIDVASNKPIPFNKSSCRYS